MQVRSPFSSFYVHITCLSTRLSTSPRRYQFICHKKEIHPLIRSLLAIATPIVDLVCLFPSHRIFSRDDASLPFAHVDVVIYSGVSIPINGLLCVSATVSPLSGWDPVSSFRKTAWLLAGW